MIGLSLSFFMWPLIFYTVGFGFLYLFLTWNYDYWKKRSIPHERPVFPFGNIWSLMTRKQSFVEFYRSFYRRFEGQRYMGYIMLKDPTLMIRDPELIKQVMVKDFSHFHDRGLPLDVVNDPMSGTLFNLQGSRWHTLRNKLSPTFTSGKMKYMFPIIRACVEQLQKTAAPLGSDAFAAASLRYRRCVDYLSSGSYPSIYLAWVALPGAINIAPASTALGVIGTHKPFHHDKTASEVERAGGTIEMKDLMARYTTDVIGSAAFGMNARSLENPDSKFRVIGRRIITADFWNSIRAMMIVFAPTLSLKLGIKRHDTVAASYFSRMVQETVTYREKNDVKRADFLQLLIGLRAGMKEDNAKGSSEKELTMEQLTAQCLVFFVGGFETSATTLTFTLYELSKNLDVQRQLRDEVDRVLEEHGGEITYDGLAQMLYMDRVIAETLRKYPPVPVLFRECTKEWTIPSAEETGSDTREWKPETRNGGHVVELGTKVHLPITGLHYDPEYFEDPERFDPERFTEEGRKHWPQFAYLPFGEGPRICIGIRFGNMQTKAGLAALLSKFEFRPSAKTPDTIVLDKMAFFPSVKGGLWLQPIERTPGSKEKAH